MPTTRALACEVIYVDDGSADDTLAIARALPATALDVQVVSLSRNFGKEAALLAGLDHARLGAVLFIDGDGQHPPELIETLVGHWLDDDYDVVYTAKAHRDEELFVRRVAVKAFYALLNSDSHVQIPENAGDFRLLSPRAAKALRQMPERNRFFKGLASWIGFRQKRIDYEPAQRAQGRSSWGLRSLIGLSLNGLTAFSVAPLRMATVLGLLLGADRFDLWRQDHLRDGGLWRQRPRLSVVVRRRHGARRRAARHARRRRRIYRQDPLRDQSPPGLFRRRA